MNKWIIGGVPEHFNLPWQDLIARRGHERHRALGRPLAWQAFPGGTGAMIEALANAEIDIALLLTEGAVAGQAHGATFEIVATYVASPLIWGVHVRPSSAHASIEDIAGARFAISRFGSGSHLMAIALANRHGWQLDASQFVTVGSLSGAIEAFAAGRADVFLWEHFMTQPVVDRGDFRRVGDFVAPWSAFVVCAHPTILERSRGELEVMLRDVGDEARRFAADPATPARLEELFGIEQNQTSEWLRQTRWADGVEFPAEAIAAARSVLVQAGAIAD